MKKILFLFIIGFLSNTFAIDDAKLYKELNKALKEENKTSSDAKDLTTIKIKAKDTNLTKKIKVLLKKDEVEKKTKKYEKILKK